MIITIGSDHRGLPQRRVIAETIESLGYQVDDKGAFTEDACDYPDVAVKVCREVSSGAATYGILVCGTGIGMSIAANKVSRIRAALCCDITTAKLSRQHNDANVLCLAGNHFDEIQFRAIVTAWLSTDFEGGRHLRRVEKMMALDAD
ncbi:ribose 5-phosphate isomerase B [Mariniblastus sp.]|jgi:ribose 5-phosphate isomerase B|nr:ribose 5-phosphate isomerase B [Mariniblastus sp.]|eukprot:COSAG01_NODE_80_length_27941_cov_1123.754687_14_plen_147_part_00